MNDDEVKKFLVDWADKIQGDMGQSLARIKTRLESAS